MIRVLHLQPKLNLACGISRTIAQIIKNSTPDFKHHIITMGGDGLERFDSINVNIETLKTDRKSLLGTFRTIKFIYRFVKQNSIDIIHSHHRYFDILARSIKSITKIKTVTSVQSKIFGKKFLSYNADKLIACSVTMRDHLILNFKVDESKIEVINNSVDPNENLTVKTRTDLTEALEVPPDLFIIGYVGRLDYEEKGVDILLDAFNKVSKIDKSVFLLIIGDGHKQKAIKEFIKSTDIPSKLINSKLNIFDYYKLMDIVVLPSRIDPFPLVMLEAGLMKLPFIGSRVDGIAEIIEHRKDGLLFSVGDADDLVNLILEIRKNKKFAHLLAENLNKKVLDQYTVNNIIPKYEKIYMDILNDK
jgi:L-malate glycosyltransferase